MDRKSVKLMLVSPKKKRGRPVGSHVPKNKVRLSFTNAMFEREYVDVDASQMAAHDGNVAAAQKVVVAQTSVAAESSRGDDAMFQECFYEFTPYEVHDAPLEETSGSGRPDSKILSYALLIKYQYLNADIYRSIVASERQISFCIPDFDTNKVQLDFDKFVCPSFRLVGFKGGVYKLVSWCNCCEDQVLARDIFRDSDKLTSSQGTFLVGMPQPCIHADVCQVN